jgi:hypothetical protein
MMIGAGIQVILRILPQPYERLSIGITDDIDLQCTPLRWHNI